MFVAFWCRTEKPVWNSVSTLDNSMMAFGYVSLDASALPSGAFF